ncbi:MAG: T9SS type A sorting domain-containing protein [Bacteroidota bacterium]|nr:T9SS type A sorting domain-containing protein [Bacteroidota bacterium]
MKVKLTLFLFTSLFTAQAFSQTLNWSNEIIVANGTTYGYTRPRIAVTSGNIPVVMWGGGMSTEPVYFARWNGTGFNMPVTVTPNNVDPAVMTWQGPDMAANGNNVFIVYKREPEMSNNIYTQKSADGGVTWSDTTRVDGMNGPYSRFPSLAVTAAGNPAVIFMTFDMSWGTAQYVVTNSTDGGLSFPMPVNVSNLGSSDVCDCCPAFIEIDGNNQAATWRRNNNNTRDMWSGVSTNSGLTFPTGMDLDNTNWMLSSCPSSGPDPYLNNDSLFTVFMSGASGDNRIYFNSKNITNQQNGYTSMLNPNIPSADNQNYPFIAGSGDTIVVVWQESSGGNINTWCTWSVNGSADLFANTTMVNTSVNGIRQNPHVAYSNGTFHFVFADLSNGNAVYRKATIAPNAVQELNEKPSFRAYPNPANGTVTLDLSAMIGNQCTIKLTDMTGRIVQSISSNGESRVAIQPQPAGVYFAEVTGDNGTVSTTRIVFVN